MPPYGDQGNDWLGLSQSQARRARNWESPITEALFPEGDWEIPEGQAMLQLPRKSQVLGAVNVSSYRSEESASAVPKNRLMPGMDRQGFVENDAYEQLVDITRGSLEILGVIDRLEQQKKKRGSRRKKVQGNIHHYFNRGVHPGERRYRRLGPTETAGPG
jgi:hypothetical protein